MLIQKMKNQLGTASFTSVLTLALALSWGSFNVFGKVSKWMGFSNSSAAEHQTVQYQFEHGKGSARLGAEDVIMDIGMITGTKETGNPVWSTPPTAAIILEMLVPRNDISWKLEKFHFVERVDGKDVRVFEPKVIEDSESRKGREPAVKFLEAKGKAPRVWDSGKRCYLYFVFPSLPEDVMTGDLVLTFYCTFPDKKHPVPYEHRFKMTRAAYALSAK